MVNRLYITNLNIISNLKKINNKLSNNVIKKECCNYTSPSNLWPIGSSYEDDTISEYDDFTVPKIVNSNKIKKIYSDISLEYIDTYSEEETE